MSMPLLPSGGPPGSGGDERESRPQSPQLAMRIAWLGGIAVVLFAILFFRLWVLQVLSAERYETAATSNQARSVEVPAPRGSIVDKNGVALVTNRPSDALSLDVGLFPVLRRECTRLALGPPDLRTEAEVLKDRRYRYRKLKPARRAAAIKRFRAAHDDVVSLRPWRGCAEDDPKAFRTLKRLSTLTKTPMRTFEDAIHASLVRSQFEPATLISDLDRSVVFYVKEHGAAYPGIRIIKRTIRAYPLGVTGVHLFGEVGQISAEQLEDTAHYLGADDGDVVGIGGLERTYDRFLRGKDGALTLSVDAAGNPQGDAILKPQAQAGLNLRLTLDAKLQVETRAILEAAIERARVGGFPAAGAGSMLVMNARTGAIRAMVSLPDYNPNRLVGPSSTRFRTLLNKQKATSPLTNRAIQGLYPPGSTYKPVTAIAAIQSKVMGVTEQIHCDPFRIIKGQKYRNFDAYIDQFMDLSRALTVSCDTVFYELGVRMYDATAKEGGYEPQPEWARKLGFGKTTGIDVAGEKAGLVPDAAWKLSYFGADNEIDKYWTTGDAVLSAIGQGNLQVTPLQMGVFYAMIANGGTFVQPHLGEQVEDGQGVVKQRFAHRATGRIALDPYILATIRAGLRGVTHDVDGTANNAFQGFSLDVAGKTGTAENAGKRDYSWFVGYTPVGDPAPEQEQIVAVCIAEQAGKGGETCAPAVRAVLAAAYGIDDDPPDVPITDPNQSDSAGSGAVGDAAAAAEAEAAAAAGTEAVQ